MRRLGLLVLVVVALAGCGGGAAPATPAAKHVKAQWEKSPADIEYERKVAERRTQREDQARALREWDDLYADSPAIMECAQYAGEVMRASTLTDPASIALAIRETVNDCFQSKGIPPRPI